MILVYDYISRGTLADHLYKLSNNEFSSSLTWNQRLSICIGAARGLDYLHTGISIIHRDVKSTNILLDQDFTAKVSDFGLAKHLSTSNPNSHVSTMVKGTFGYLDPSYFKTGRLSRRSDTYAFGVVLLEVLCGRPAVDPRLDDHGGSLVTWAQERIRKGKVDRIVASNLRDEITADCLKTFVGVAKKCLRHEPQERPTMAEVAVELQLAFRQQERKTQTHFASLFILFTAFWNRFIPTENSASGSLDQHKVDIHTPSNNIAVIQEDELKYEHKVDMPLSENKQSDNVLPIAVPAIPIDILIQSIKRFSAESILIGERSNGRVYYGFVNGQAVAIKELEHSSLLEQEFLTQVSVASSLKHKHVVQLLGYCLNDVGQFLAYEFAPCGSLRDFLHRQGVQALSWSQRVKIAVGAAKGLEYIHGKELIHSNIKSSNILLFDHVEVAKIGDSIHPTQVFRCSTILKFGGYDAPEYAMTGQLSRSSDVYSFGVVLLELLTGTEPSDYTYFENRKNLVAWARRRLHKGSVNELLDHRLKGYPRLADVAKMAKIASDCVQDIPHSRPNMSQVVSDLQPLLNSYLF